MFLLFFLQSYIKSHVSTKSCHYTAEIASERHHWRKTAFSFMETSKHTKPSACVRQWHRRKALYLYVNEDVTAKPIPPPQAVQELIFKMSRITD